MAWGGIMGGGGGREGVPGKGAEDRASDTVEETGGNSWDKGENKPSKKRVPRRRVTTWLQKNRELRTGTIGLSYVESLVPWTRAAAWSRFKRGQEIQGKGSPWVLQILLPD